MADAQRGTGGGFVNGVLSLRGILAVLVATSHTLNFFLLSDYAGSVLQQGSLRDILLKLAGGTINVPLMFFVISGFAISLSLDRKAATGNFGATYAAFFVRRILRLYPANTAALLGILALSAYFLMGRVPIDFTPYHWRSYDFQMDWLNGTIFNPLKWTSVVGNLAIASWSLNLVAWSLYVEVCAIPILPLLYRISRENDPYIDAAMLVVLVSLNLASGGKLWLGYWFAFYLGMMIQLRGKRWASLVAGAVGGPRPAAALSVGVMLLSGLMPIDWPPAVIIDGLGVFTLIASRDPILTLRGVSQPSPSRSGGSKPWRR